MNDDRDLEERLEQWLANSARPMPRERLSEVISEVSRGSVVSRATFGSKPRWQAGAALLAAGVIVAVAVVASLGNITGPGANRSGTPMDPPSASPPASARPSVVGLRWNAQAEFIREAPGANPADDRYGNADVWSYRYGAATAHDPAAVLRLTTFDPARVMWATREPNGVRVWLDPSRGLVLHPSGGGDSGRSGVVAWTSPIDGAIKVSGYFFALQWPCAVAADGVAVAIIHERTELWGMALMVGNRAFTERLVVARGDFVYFSVDPVGNSNCDGTGLVLDITQE